MHHLHSASQGQNTGKHGVHYVPTFHFDPAKACYCGSGKAFGHCCGNQHVDRATPRGIVIHRQFLSDAECKRFLRFACKQKRTPLSVVDSHKNQEKRTVHKQDSLRVTQQVLLGRKQQQANTWFHTACSKVLAKVSQRRAQWYESPHLLRYGPGGKYDIHADGEHFDFETRQFYRFIDRDFSMLIYLNDDFSGGVLNFPWLNYQYQPAAGDLVCFPSNHIFTHESLPIISGTKYALVSWGAFTDSPRVRQPRSMLGICRD